MVFNLTLLIVHNIMLREKFEEKKVLKKNQKLTSHTYWSKSVVYSVNRDAVLIEIYR